MRHFCERLIVFKVNVDFWIMEFSLNKSLELSCSALRAESHFVRADVRLEQIGNISRHLLDSCVVECLDVLKGALVLFRDEIDGHTLAPETAAASNSVARENDFRKSRLADIPMAVTYLWI